MHLHEILIYFVINFLEKRISLERVNFRDIWRCEVFGNEQGFKSKTWHTLFRHIDICKIRVSQRNHSMNSGLVRCQEIALMAPIGISASQGILEGYALNIFDEVEKARREITSLLCHIAYLDSEIGYSW